MSAPFTLPEVGMAHLDAARAIHTRRPRDAALDQGTALLAALGIESDHPATGGACCAPLSDAVDVARLQRKGGLV